jgi:hypothetical protein
VDFVYGLSPVISIEQKTIANNPRSTVGTMTDIASYLDLLYATIAVPHCPRTGELAPSRTSSQILEAILALPEGAEIELRAPVFQQYGEELDFVLTEVRKKGCRIPIIDGKPVDISAEVDLDESKVKNMDAVVDRFVAGRKHEKAIKAGIAATLLVGDRLLQVQIVKGAGKAEVERFYRAVAARRTTSSTVAVPIAARQKSSQTTDSKDFIRLYKVLYRTLVGAVSDGLCIRAMSASHSLRNSARRLRTWALASSKFLNVRWPLITLHARHAATRLSRFFLPLRALGRIKSTVMTREFSKLAIASSPQYWQR